MKLNINFPNYKLPLLATLVLMAVAVFLIRPLLKAIVFEKQNLAQKKILFESLQNQADNALKSALPGGLNNDLILDMENFNNLFIEKNLASDVIELLEKKANQRQLIIKIKIDQNSQNSNIIVLNSILEGSFKDIYNYLQDVESLPFALLIDAIKLEKTLDSLTKLPQELIENPQKPTKKIQALIKISIFTKEFLKNAK